MQCTGRRVESVPQSRDAVYTIQQDHPWASFRRQSPLSRGESPHRYVAKTKRYAVIFGRLPSPRRKSSDCTGPPAALPSSRHGAVRGCGARLTAGAGIAHRRRGVPGTVQAGRPAPSNRIAGSARRREPWIDHGNHPRRVGAKPRVPCGTPGAGCHCTRVHAIDMSGFEAPACPSRTAPKGSFRSRAGARSSRAFYCTEGKSSHPGTPKIPAVRALAKQA